MQIPSAEDGSSCKNGQNPLEVFALQRPFALKEITLLLLISTSIGIILQVVCMEKGKSGTQLSVSL